MHILLAGATGKTGKKILKQLLDKNYKVTAIVRNQNKMDIQNPHLTVKIADVLNAESLGFIAEDKSYTHVIIALGASSLKKDLIRSTGTENMLKKIKEAQTNPKISIISSAGAGNSIKQIPFAFKIIIKLLLKNVILDHEAQENYVINSGLTYTIARPTGLTDHPQTNNYKVLITEKLSSGKISRSDVAHFIVTDLTDAQSKIVALCN